MSACPAAAERLPPALHRIIVTQFASALADNALLIVAMALLAQQGRAAWWAPLLKFGFNLCYVVFAPCLGPLADALPKARLMAAMSGVKALGLLALLLGCHPVLAYAVVGLGAAAYAPAKYGLITEIVPPRQLVAANAWIEVSVVGAALLGTVAGGWLVSGQWTAWSATVFAAQPAVQGLQAHAGPLTLSLCLLLAIHLAAWWACRWLPDSGARYELGAVHPLALWRGFAQAQRRLWADAEGGLSLAVTTLFWGVGSVMQFMVLRWATDLRGLPLSQAAQLPALVALGAIAGAALAARHVPLASAWRVLPLGLGMGLLLPLLAHAGPPWWAGLLLVLAGAAGGLLVVPMNALLQHRGCTLLSAGQSIAVQGFNENLSVLLMLALYAGLIAMDLPIRTLMWGFGLGLSALVGLLMLLPARRAQAA